MAETKVCSCGVRMIWAKTPTGATAPIVESPSPDGNVLLLAPASLGTLLAVTLSKELLDEARARGVPLRLNHFADCPDREKYKRE